MSSGPARASADVLRLLAGFIDVPGESHPAWASALGLDAPDSLAVWKTRHTHVFVEQCYPYASVYLGSEGSIGGGAADRVAGFRRVLGASIDGPPDALGALLTDYAELADRSRHDPQAQHARRALLWEHLLCWLLPYLDSVVRIAPAPYHGWAMLMKEIFIAEAEIAGLPAQVPLQLRAAPAPDKELGALGLDAVIDALLVPVRSGLIVARDDLTAVAATIGVASGVGGRRFMLRRLLEQDPGAALHQLAVVAHAQASARADEQAVLGDIALFWSERAAASARRLDAMAAECADLGPAAQSNRT